MKRKKSLFGDTLNKEFLRNERSEYEAKPNETVIELNGTTIRALIASELFQRLSRRFT